MGNDQETKLPGFGRLHFLEMELKLDVSYRSEGISVSDNDVAACIWFDLEAGLAGLLFTDCVVLHATVEPCPQKQLLMVMMVDVYVLDEIVIDLVRIYRRAWCSRLRSGIEWILFGIDNGVDFTFRLGIIL